MAQRTLLLNSTYEPLQVISWQRAVTMAWLGKVEVVRHYDRHVRSLRMKMAVPAVVRLQRFVRRRRVRLGYSRRSLFTRDGYRCQYCGVSCSPANITCDHVVPRSQGGVTAWDNVVTACESCNRKKGGRTPEQAGMRLVRAPRRPEELPLVFAVRPGNATPEAWHEFLLYHRATRRAAG